MSQSRKPPIPPIISGRGPGEVLQQRPPKAVDVDAHGSTHFEQTLNTTQHSVGLFVTCAGKFPHLGKLPECLPPQLITCAADAYGGVTDGATAMCCIT